MSTQIAKACDLLPAVALINPKYRHNVGAAFRACACFGARALWFTGSRIQADIANKVRLPREERMRQYHREVHLEHDDAFATRYGRDVTPVAVEIKDGAENLLWFEHPERAVYVFGPEDGSLRRPDMLQCHRFVSIPTRHCTNLAAAVYLVLYDRHAKRVAAGLEQPWELHEHRGFIDERNPLI